MKIRELIDILVGMDPEDEITVAPARSVVWRDDVRNITGVGAVYDGYDKEIAKTAIRYRV